MTPIKENRDWEEELDAIVFKYNDVASATAIMDEFIKPFIKSLLASHEAKVKEELIEKFEELKNGYGNGQFYEGYERAINEVNHLLAQSSQEE